MGVTSYFGRSTYTYVVLGNMFFSTRTSLIFLISAFFCKRFFLQNNTFTQSNFMRALLHLLVMFSVFVRQKVINNENGRFTDHASRIRLWDCSKLAINQCNDNDVAICWHDILSSSCHVQLLIQILCQYHYWFWSYDDFHLQEIE